MSKNFLACALIILLFIGLGMALYPFRKNKRLMFIFAPLFLLIAGGLYGYWGGWFDWTRALELSLKKKQVQSILKSVHGVDELIEKLQAKLNNNPNSARGWYLLGRLYAHEGQWKKAKEAFSRAHDLKPNDALITMNLVQSLLQLNQQTFNDDIRKLVEQVLKNDPNQPDALAMVAMDAYKVQNYTKAIQYWRKLLKLAPKDSEEALFIQKAIKKAQEHQ